MSSSSLISPCLDHLADLALWEAELAEDPAVAESALVSRLSRVPDRRSRRGRRHPLVAVLALTACATLVVGGDGIAAIWQWAARTSQEKLGRLGAIPAGSGVQGVGVHIRQDTNHQVTTG